MVKSTILSTWRIQCFNTDLTIDWQHSWIRIKLGRLNAFIKLCVICVAACWFPKSFLNCFGLRRWVLPFTLATKLQPIVSPRQLRLIKCKSSKIIVLGIWYFRMFGCLYWHVNLRGSDKLYSRSNKTFLVVYGRVFRKHKLWDSTQEKDIVFRNVKFDVLKTFSSSEGSWDVNTSHEVSVEPDEDGVGTLSASA